jgi:hypothetical protein
VDLKLADGGSLDAACGEVNGAAPRHPCVRAD